MTGIERLRELVTTVLSSVGGMELYDGSGKLWRIISDIADQIEREQDELRAEVSDKRPRLMPEGMEWPRFEDGKPVCVGDEFEKAGKKMTVMAVHFSAASCYLCAGGHGEHYVAPGERVKRPAPKVLDADGVEIREGDTVWHLQDEEPWEWTVLKPYDEYDGVQTVLIASHDVTGHARPENLTHRAPVLAADGKPLREGETVYLQDGESFTVSEVMDDGRVRVRELTGYMYLRAERLTHERPDSLARLAEDIGAMVVAWRANKDLFDAQEAAAGCVGENTLGAALESLTRRVMALAERDA